MGDLLLFLKSFYCINFFYLPLYKNNSTDTKKFICIASITTNVFFNKTKDEMHREKNPQKTQKHTMKKMIQNTEVQDFSITSEKLSKRLNYKEGFG